ncbi:MAG: DUF523 domain-containing protein [candidate division Zixibacteria bacterium]|nr:DUF523 domain-containing protein [candidate division Zixibacteria bacterium]
MTAIITNALISACLVGLRCRYDGRTKTLPNLAEYENKYNLTPVCPEIEGGLDVPRPKSWIENGSGKDVLDGNTIVVNENGQDVSLSYLDGAKKVLELARSKDARVAILKSKSPACGCGQVYNADKLVNGNGVTAELLMSHGIKVIAV